MKRRVPYSCDPDPPYGEETIFNNIYDEKRKDLIFSLATFSAPDLIVSDDIGSRSLRKIVFGQQRDLLAAVRFFAGRPDKPCSGMDDRRIYDCDECGPGTLPDSYPAKEIRPHAAFPAGHRIYFRVAERHEYGFDIRT